MRWIQLFKFYYLILFYTLIGSVAIAQSSGEIQYIHAATIPFDWSDSTLILHSFTDSLSGEVLDQYSKSDGIPLFYCQEIATSVCFDNKCRPLFIRVYWNITGRYLGFYLPENEFLSRYDHEPFSRTDYELLHELLADPYLPLRNVSYQELISQSTKDNEGIDGVSGATSASLAPYVVTGAAYTTYTLWNIIHGSTKNRIKELTEEEMSSELLEMILRSPSSEDRIWGLNQIDGKKRLDARVTDALLEIITGEDFYAAFTAINMISPVHLSSESVQKRLFNEYQKINYNLRKTLIGKFKEAPMISEKVIGMSRDILAELNGEQLGYILELYNQHEVYDSLMINSVAELLNSENKFVSQKAYKFLIEIGSVNEGLNRKLEKYQQPGKE